MKVDIWSDIRCPFCYIGKRKFELALAQFENKEKVEIVWHSFQLDPNLQAVEGVDVYDHLADIKGMNRDWSVQIHDQVTQTAAEVGLVYNFDKAVIANSFDAHRLIQLAKTHGLGDAAEEALFKAYFTEGVNISDHSALTAIGVSLGIASGEIESVLTTNAFSDEVKADGIRAQKLGIRGVPFFLINDQVTVSGAQSPGVFLNSLETAWQEYKSSASSDNTDGVCSIDGNC